MAVRRASSVLWLVRIDCAKAREASTNVGSFSSVKACWGVLETVRVQMESSRLGASKLASMGGADEVFDEPGGLAGFNGEVVEQFAVAGGFVLGTQVFETGGEAGAEELFPEAVGEDSGGEGVFGGDDPFGEVEAGEAGGIFDFGISIFDLKKGGDGGGDDFAGFVLQVASGEDSRRDGLVGHSNKRWGLSISAFQED